jgi:hypothetical protein
MDTAQRGMGLDWAAAQHLIRLSLDAAKDHPGAPIASGAGTDHLAPGPDVTVDDVIRAYEEQCEAVEAMGGRIILMASRALAKAAKSPADYERVYARILGGVKQPVIIHWLGEMFDPALEGYWGNHDHMAAMETALAVIHAHADKVDGVKISLLDDQKEIAMRRRLPRGPSITSSRETSTLIEPSKWTPILPSLSKANTSRHPCAQNARIRSAVAAGGGRRSVALTARWPAKSISH